MTETRKLPVKLTKQEIADANARAVTAMAEEARLKADLKAVQMEKRRHIIGAERERERALDVARTGVEEREVAVIHRKDFINKVLNTHRLDDPSRWPEGSNGIIASQPLDAGDLTPDLFDASADKQLESGGDVLELPAGEEPTVEKDEPEPPPADATEAEPPSVSKHQFDGIYGGAPTSKVPRKTLDEMAIDLGLGSMPKLSKAKMLEHVVEAYEKLPDGELEPEESGDQVAQ